jgi:hypothetical protein
MILSFVKVFCLVALITSTVTSNALNCKYGVLPRKEFRTLTTQEKTDLFTGIKALLKPGSAGTKDGFSYFANLARIHYEHHSYIHYVPMFLPWHRYFLVHLEQELQKVTNKPVTIPYWNWAVDAEDPEKAPVFAENAFGGDGRSADGCIATGAYALAKSQYPTDHCIRRKWSFPDRMFYIIPHDRINEIIVKSKTFDMFRRTLEMSPHGNLHEKIGGDMGSFYSPNDPLFFSHHCMVDKIWWTFQRVKPALANAYEGEQTDFIQLETGPYDEFRSPYRPAKVTDKLTPFNEWVVSDMFETEPLCYTYHELPQELYPKSFAGKTKALTGPIE